MAYRRRQGLTRTSTLKQEIHYPDDDSSSSPSSSSSLAAQAIRASAAHRESSLSSAYGDSAFSYASRDSVPQRSPSRKDSASYEYTSLKTSNESKYGLWGILARKAKAILEEEDVDHAQISELPGKSRPHMLNTSTAGQFHQPYLSPEGNRKMDNPRLQKGLEAITSSLNYIGDTIGNALEEGRTIVENKTADIIQETKKLHIRRKGSGPGSSDAQNQVSPAAAYGPWQQQQMQTNQETQLKASRDVAMATAAKAKLLLRELKTVKADLAFAKERCSQLEEENRILRESREKGDNHADDDLIRLQLETLLAEKARLAHENSVYARENRFLREIVEYHQLTMQDVVYLDEGIEEVTEVYPIPAVSKVLSISPPSPMSSPNSPPPPPIVTKETVPLLGLSPEITNDLRNDISPPSCTVPIPVSEDTERRPYHFA